MGGVPARGRPMRERRVTRGQSLVELALVLPVLIVLMVGIIDLGRVFYTKVTLANAARVAAEYAVNPNVLVANNGNLTAARDAVKAKAVSEAANQNVTISQSDVVFNGTFVPGTIYTVKVAAPFSPITPLASTLLGSSTLMLSYTIELRVNCNASNIAPGATILCAYPTPTP